MKQQISKKNRERNQYTFKPRIYPCRNVLSSNVSTLRWCKMRGDREEMEQNIKQWRTTTNCSLRSLQLLKLSTCLKRCISWSSPKKEILICFFDYTCMFCITLQKKLVALKLKLSKLNKILKNFSSWDAKIQMIEFSFYDKIYLRSRFARVAGIWTKMWPQSSTGMSCASLTQRARNSESLAREIIMQMNNVAVPDGNAI